MSESQAAEYGNESQKSTQTFGGRLTQAILAAGYKNVMQFCLDRKYRSPEVYKWIRGAHEPRAKYVIRLAADLNVSPGWLLFGDQGAERSGGGIMSTTAGAVRRPLAKVSRAVHSPALVRAV